MILILLLYCQSQNKLIDVDFIYTFAFFSCAVMGFNFFYEIERNVTITFARRSILICWKTTSPMNMPIQWLYLMMLQYPKTATCFIWTVILVNSQLHCIWIKACFMQFIFFQNIIKIAWIQDLIWTCLRTNVCTYISPQIIVKILKLGNRLLKMSRPMMWIVLSTCVSKKFKIGTIMDTKIHSTTV